MDHYQSSLFSVEGLVEEASNIHQYNEILETPNPCSSNLLHDENPEAR